MFQRHPIQNQEMMFITTNTHRRVPAFAEPSHAHEAVSHLYRVQAEDPFLLYGFVIMPDHIHLLVRVPETGSISKIMQAYKYGLCFQVGQGRIWQSRFHLKVPDDSASVLRYIHLNPVRRGLVALPEDYPWSSASGKWDVTELGCGY